MKEHILEIGRDSTWYLVAQISYAAMGFVSVPIFTRIFTPSQYGIYTLVVVSVALAAPLIFIPFTTSTLRYYPEYEERGELDVFYSSVLHYMPHFLLLTLAVALPVAAFVLPLGKNRLYICLAIVIFASLVIFNLLITLLQARQMARQYAIFWIIMGVGRYLVGAALASWFHAGVAGVLWGYLGALLLVVPVELLVLSTPRFFKWSKYSPELMGEFLRFGLVLILVNISSNILTSADRYMVQAMRGSREVGLYSVVYTLVVDIFAIILTAVELGSMPVIMKTYEREGDERTAILLNRITRYFLILLVPSSLGMWQLRFRILSVITQPQYLPAAKAVLPLILGISLCNLAWIPIMIFYVKKKTKLSMIPISMAAALNIGLNFWLIPRYGFAGSAWATMIAYVFLLAAILFFTERYMHWRFPWWDSVKIIVATGVMGFALYGLNKISMRGAAGLTLIILAGTAVFFGALLLFGGVTANELAFVGSVARRLPVIGSLFKKNNGEGKS